MKDFIEFIYPIELWEHDVVGVKEGFLKVKTFFDYSLIEIPISTSKLSLKQIESLLLGINLLYKERGMTIKANQTLDIIEQQICDQIIHAASKSWINEAQIKTIEDCATLFEGSNLNQNISRIRLFLLAESILLQKI